ncbi:MAG: hypothetical protein U0610_29530 [bacterium]
MNAIFIDEASARALSSREPGRSLQMPSAVARVKDLRGRQRRLVADGVGVVSDRAGRGRARVRGT